MQEIIKLETNAVTTMSDFVQIKDEQVYTTSRIVAEKFGKRHDNVVQAIENIAHLKNQVSENIGGLKNQPAKMRFSGVNFNVAENFIETTYVDEQGKLCEHQLSLTHYKFA